MKIGLFAASAAVVLGLGATLAIAAPPGAREFPIGTITYEAQPQREVFTLRRGEGQFRGLRLDVRQNDVDIRDLRITYDDGTSEVIRVNQLVRAGSSSRVFDVDLRRREVRSVAVTYLPQGAARVTLFALGAMPGPGPAPGPVDWTRLGCKDVRFLVDRDTLKVNREGRFGALWLSVRKAPVEMFTLRISYMSGVKQDVPVRDMIMPGAPSRPIELLGRERGIERIEMIYRSLPSNKGTAEICIDGLER